MTDAYVTVPERWVEEAVATLEAATTIGQRSCNPHDHLHYANHDRLIREALNDGYVSQAFVAARVLNAPYSPSDGDH